MKRKFIFLLVGTLLAMLAGFGIRGCEVKHVKAELTRQTENVNSLRLGLERSKTEVRESAATVLQQRVTLAELEQSKDSALAVADRLGVKNKRLLAITSTVLKTDTPIFTPVKDSIVYVEGKIDTLRCLDYSDRWTRLTGCDKGGQFTGKISHMERLTLLEYTKPKKFLGIKFGVKSLNFAIVSENPNTEIVLLEHKKIEK